MASTSSQPFECNTCHKRFTRHENLTRHAAAHEPTKRARTLTCPICQTTFSRSDLQHRHMTRKHPGVHVRKTNTGRRTASLLSTSKVREWGQGGLEDRSTSSASPEDGWNEEHSNSSGSGISQQDSPTTTRANEDWYAQNASVNEGRNYLDPASTIIDLTQQDSSAVYRQQDHSTDEDCMWTQHGLRLYFDEFAPSLPFIHQATFDSAMAPRYLVLSMVCIGLQLSTDSDEAADLASRSYQQAIALLDAPDAEQDRSKWGTLGVVQSLLLLEVYTVFYLCEQACANNLRLHSRLVSLARSCGLLRKTAQQSTTGEDLEAVWQDFVYTESCKRTILAVHQMDALWYQLLSTPRLLSHLEIKHEIPCPQNDWTASSSAQWAYQRLTSRITTPCPTYADAIRQTLAPKPALDGTLAEIDSFGRTSIAHFAWSSLREVSGWSSITGNVSMDRVEPLKVSLLNIAPHNPSSNGPGDLSFRATWEMAMIDLHIWSLSHTDGAVHSSIDVALQHSTYLATSRNLIFNADIVRTIRPHLDWFLRYLDVTLHTKNEPPWVTLFAFKAFLTAWQCLRHASEGVMDVIGIPDRETRAATSWARSVFSRRNQRRYITVILRCLDLLDECL